MQVRNPSPEDDCTDLTQQVITLRDELRRLGWYSHSPQADTVRARMVGLSNDLYNLGCPPVLIRNPPPPPPVITVLLVLDGRKGSLHYASFGPGDPNPVDSTSLPHADDYFGLSEVIRTLTSAGFLIFKAHRDEDPTDLSVLSPEDAQLFRPNYQHFKFDENDLNFFDQIWLFGVGAPGITAAIADTNDLTEAELLALTEFMNQGGGVFATGDHADLGAPLCGRVPRVRTMRKWYLNGNPLLLDPSMVAPDSPMTVESTQLDLGPVIRPRKIIFL